MNKTKRQLKRLWRRICVGLVAAGRTENANKIAPVGATDFKARHGLPVKVAVAVAVIAATAAPVVNAGGSGGAYVAGQGLVAGARAAARGIGTYATYDNLSAFLGALNAGANGTKQGLYVIDQTTNQMTQLDNYQKGYAAGWNAAYGAYYGTYSAVATGPVGGSPGGFHYMTICDY
jgi:hypothetical protein